MTRRQFVPGGGGSTPTWIDTVMSSIMWIVGHRLIINTIQLIFSTIAAILTYIYRKLTRPSPH